MIEAPMLGPARWLWPGSRVVRVIDGDTYEVTLTMDVGFGRRLVHDRQRIRLAGVDTWPAGSPKGLAATGAVTGLAAAGPWTVETLKPYKYGGTQDSAEYMAHVTLNDGRDLAQVLIDAGLALPYDGRGPRPTKEDR